MVTVGDITLPISLIGQESPPTDRDAATTVKTRSAALNIHVADPFADERWNELVDRHPRASAFHKRGWLKALQRTYGYEPFVLTTAAPGETMNDGVVFCQISSWATGTRAVSLPFADHCEPLISGSGQIADFLEWLRTNRSRQRWKYVEIRPLLPFEAVNNAPESSSSYCLHELDTRPSLEHVFHHMHRDCVRRRIRRAEREGLSYEVGRTPSFLEVFYQLLLITRRRHGTLPQPKSWFRNLLTCLGADLDIWVARKDDLPIASLLTLNHGRSVVYKYGCSDARFHKLGGMPFLFWKLIEESKARGVVKVDFGRTDSGNDGLIRFKDRLGARKHTLTYYQYPGGNKRSVDSRTSETARQIVSVLPDSICEAAGRILYRHMG